MKKKYTFFILVILYVFAGKVWGQYEEIPEEEGDGIYIETVASGSIPILNAKSAILYDMTYDRVLYEKNARQRRANASTTKMVTALVAVERGNLQDVVKVSHASATVGGSTIHLCEGDLITLGDLIKGLLVHSGNDSAVAIAEYIAGSVEQFAILMNEKLEEIGAVDTKFVTPHGLDAENHYSTAYDLCMIAQTVLQNSYLADIVAQKSVTVMINGKERTFQNTNEMLSYYPGANGVKTGYTGEAGRCIVTSAQREGRQCICVVLGCDSKKNRTVDSIRLLDYGFEMFDIVDLLELFSQKFSFTVEKSAQTTYQIESSDPILYPLQAREREKITAEYHPQPLLVAPIDEGTRVGEVVIRLEGIPIRKIEYFSPQKIARKTWKDYWKQLLQNSWKNYENMVEKIWKI